MPDTVYKKYLLTIDISSKTRQVIPTNTTFWTGDIETGKLNINFVSKNQPVNLTNATVLLGFYFETGVSKLIDSKDGSVVIDDARQGRCHVIMPSYKFDYSGLVLIHVYIQYNNGKQLDCATIATEFERSWLDQELPEMEAYYIKRIEDWLVEIEAETILIKGELEARLAELRQEIMNAQSQAYNIQAQINANNIVTQDYVDTNFVKNSYYVPSGGAINQYYCVAKVTINGTGQEVNFRLAIQRTNINGASTISGDLIFRYRRRSAMSATSADSTIFILDLLYRS